MRKTIKKILSRLHIFSQARVLEQYANAIFLKVHEKDFELLPEYINGGVIADVGANMGQSIISFRKLFPNSPIHAFEPNPKCIKTLKNVARLVGGEVMVKQCSVGDKNLTLTFYVPVISGEVELFQEGSFDADTFSQRVTVSRIGQPFTLKETEINVIKLDDLNDRFSLIKIDVQGYEKNVLDGAIELIKKDRPVIVLEKDLRSDAAILSMLGDFGYKLIEGVGNNIYLPSQS